ncbi:MAG: tetratricopeptide repeat protein [Candidatus Zixiibacteriota bacterium]
MFVNDSTIDFFTNRMILVKVNAEVDTTTATKYHAIAYPTSVLLRKSGEEVDRLVGYAPATEYIQTFDDYSNGIGTLADLIAKAEGGVDRPLYLQIADKYKYRGDGAEAQTWFARVIESGDPADSLSGEARLAFADFLRRDKRYDDALDAYRKIEQEFTATYHGQDAVIYQAIVYRQKGDTAQAISTFGNFLERYPNSSDTTYAREQIEKLKNPKPVAAQ